VLCRNQLLSFRHPTCMVYTFYIHKIRWLGLFFVLWITVLILHSQNKNDVCIMHRTGYPQFRK
jgi:hypothetical protein